MSGLCPWCLSERSAPGPTLPDVTYRECRSCGSGYVVEAPIAFRDYYEEYAPALVEELPPILEGRYHAMIEVLEGMVPSRTLLEVGCGNGHFMAVARARGWEAQGVELSRAHVDRARAAGLDVRYGDLVADRLLEEGRYGAVVMIEVVEHVPSPRTLLEGAARRLEPGGITFLTTPSYGSITRRLLGRRWSVLSHEHVALASPAGLRHAMEDTGHRVERLRSKSLFLSDYRRLLARPGSPPAAPLAAENAALRDRIEASPGLTVLKGAANALLGVTGLGEALECWARRVD